MFEYILKLFSFLPSALYVYEINSEFAAWVEPLGISKENIRNNK